MAPGSVLLFACALANVTVTAAIPQTPVWPEQFHAVLLQNRTGSNLALVDLWYDWPAGRNFNIVHKQLGPTIYDLELNSGAQYVWFSNREDCRRIQQPVGILPPDWLANATYLGVEQVDTFEVDHWTKGPWPTTERMFVHYYSDRATGQPVFWQFFDNAKFHILEFEVNKTLPDSAWQEPTQCHHPELSTEPTPLSLDELNAMPKTQHEMHTTS